MMQPRTVTVVRASASAVLTAVLAILVGHAAWSQAPRTIRLVVPYTAGGPTDLVARVLADEIGRAEGATIVVENRPGAAGVVGIELVSRAAPDGATLVIVGPSFVVLPHLRKLNYDPVTSFEPICQLLHYPNVILVNAASPYGTLAELLEAGRARPRELTMGSVGPATSSQIAVEVLKRAAKVDLTFIPFPGYAPAINALLGQHVTSALVDYSVVVEQLKGGKLRALAVTSSARMAALPEVPTVAELGYKDFEVGVWYGLLAPAQTPGATVQQIAGWTAAALQAPEIRQRLLALGFVPDAICGADFSAFVRKQYDDYGRVIGELNIKVE